VTTRKFPDELLALVATKTGACVQRVREVLVEQCPQVQPRLEASLKEQRDEAERQREAAAAIERAAEAERAALRAAEEKRRRERMGAFICGVCGRWGCPVMPMWRDWAADESAPSYRPYDGNNGPAVGSRGTK